MEREGAAYDRRLLWKPDNLSDIDNDIMLKIPKSALRFKKKRIGGDALFEPHAFDPSLRFWNLIASW